jgi:hypothetical protein
MCPIGVSSSLLAKRCTQDKAYPPAIKCAHDLATGDSFLAIADALALTGLTCLPSLDLAPLTMPASPVGSLSSEVFSWPLLVDENVMNEILGELEALLHYRVKQIFSYMDHRGSLSV